MWGNLIRIPWTYLGHYDTSDPGETESMHEISFSLAMARELIQIYYCLGCTAFYTKYVPHFFCQWHLILRNKDTEDHFIIKHVYFHTPRMLYIKPNRAIFPTLLPMNIMCTIHLCIHVNFPCRKGLGLAAFHVQCSVFDIVFLNILSCQIGLRYTWASRNE